MTEIDGKIYKVTSPSGRVYIGQTIRPLKMRWYNYKNPKYCKGQPRLYKSFQKYGVENHTFEPIITGIKSKEMLDWYEIFYIAVYDATGENGLNCTIGGEGNLIPEEELKYGLRKGDEGYDKIQRKAWRERNPEKVRGYGKTHYEKYKEQMRAKGKAWREANPEKVKGYGKAWREANKEEIKIAQKAWYEDNKEKIKAKSKAWYEDNKERAKIRNKAYRDTHKEEIKANYKIYKKANLEAVKAQQKAWYEREKIISKHFGYKITQWNSLPSELKAQMRKEFTEHPN